MLMLCGVLQLINWRQTMCRYCTECIPQPPAVPALSCAEHLSTHVVQLAALRVVQAYPLHVPAQ
jgi:hypothetical protein